MGLPDWWDERRFGLFVQTSGAAVPAWAPIGARADHYRQYLGEPEPGREADGAELVEVLAHHRDRWGHIPRFDEFIPLLRFGEFDAEVWARLAVDAGARYASTVALDADGWVWWDAPTTTRTMVTNGPHRNVLADFAGACERNDLPLGVSYSLTTVDDRPGSSALVRHDVTDLADRYGIEFFRFAPGSDEGAALPIVDAARSALPGTGDAVRVFDLVPPNEILDQPWELHRSINRGSGYNRAERKEHLLDAHAVVALLTEVVAKGGHLLLGVGVDADGAVADLHAAPLREAGEWIRRHDHLLNHGRPWEVWGDRQSRLIDVDGAIGAVDIAGRGHFAGLAATRCRVDAVELDDVAVPFHQDADGLHIDLHRSPLVQQRAHRVDVDVYHVHISEAERPIGLFESEPREPIELAPLLRGTSDGDIVQLGDGTYLGPVTVPDGVTIRGLGGARTVVEGTTPSVTVGARARLEHLHVRGVPGREEPSVAIAGDSALVLGCRVEGIVEIRADNVVVRATSAASIRASGVDGSTIVRCQITGGGRGSGVRIRGGSGHRVDSCEIDDHRDAVRLVETTETAVTGNNLSARNGGVRLDRTEGAEVQGNFVSHTMRGIHIDGGANAMVHGNAVCDGDSGAVAESGATGCMITGNTWERCRIGVLTWDATNIEIHSNDAIDLHEPDATLITGP